MLLRAGNAHLADEQIVFADLTVVPDLHQVVDFCPRANARSHEGSAVDGGAGANFDVVGHLDTAELWHLHVASFGQAIAETIGANYRIRVNDDAIADDGIVVENHVGIDCDVVAKAAAPADDGAAVNLAAGADDRILAHDSTRKNADAQAELRRGMDGSAAIDAVRSRVFHCVQMAMDGYESGERIVDVNEGHAVCRNSCGRNHGRSPAVVQ